MATRGGGKKGSRLVSIGDREKLGTDDNTLGKGGKNPRWEIFFPEKGGGGRLEKKEE